MNASNQWYYANQHNEHQGPVDAAVLVKKLERGELTPKTLVWREGMAEWQPVSELEVHLRANTVAEDSALHAPDARINPADAPAAGSVAAETTSPYTAPLSTLSVNAGEVLAEGGEIVYAGFWKRAAADMIDSLIINTVSSILLVILAPLFGVGLFGVGGLFDDGAGNLEALSAELILFLGVFQLLSLILTATYYTWLHSSLQMATLGKMAVGIKVVRLNGERISVARAIGRYFAFILSGMTMGIGFIMAGLTQRKQALHDMICDTLVVDKWAFTDRPELQQKGLGAVAIAVLVLSGVLFAAVFVFVMAMVVMMAVGVSGYPR